MTSFIFYNSSRQCFDIDDTKITLASSFSTRWLFRYMLKVRDYAEGYLLDVGCGSKPYHALFNLNAYVGVDWPQSGHSQQTVDAFADAQILPFASNSFDTVLCTEVIEHLPQPWTAVAEMARVLKPGGCLILTAPFVHNLHEQPHDYFRFTGYGLLALVRQCHLEPLTIWERGGVLSVLFDQWMRLLSNWLRAVMRRLHFPKLLQSGILKLTIILPQQLAARLAISLAERSEKVISGELVNPARLTLGYVLVARCPTVEEDS